MSALPGFRFLPDFGTIIRKADALGTTTLAGDIRSGISSRPEVIVKKAQRRRLERAGWKVGTVAQLLDLSPAENALIETKLRSRKLAK